MATRTQRKKTKRYRTIWSNGGWYVIGPGYRGKRHYSAEEALEEAEMLNKLFSKQQEVA